MCNFLKARKHISPYLSYNANLTLQFAFLVFSLPSMFPALGQILEAATLGSFLSLPQVNKLSGKQLQRPRDVRVKQVKVHMLTIFTQQLDCQRLPATCKRGCNRLPCGRRSFGPEGNSRSLPDFCQTGCSFSWPRVAVFVVVFLHGVLKHHVLERVGELASFLGCECYPFHLSCSSTPN